MRIISPFNDYYDQSTGWDTDPKLVFNREPFRTSFKQFPSELAGMPVWYFDRSAKLRVSAVWVGVGTRIFPRWIIGEQIPLRFNEGLIGFTNTQLVNVLRERWKEESDLGDFYDYFFSKEPIRWSTHVSEFLEETADTPELRITEDALRSIGASTFAFTVSHTFNYQPISHDAVGNVRLASFGIQSEMDAFTAYQEIAMALNILQDNNDPNPRVVGGDEVILRQKGFDENSFRNAAPSEKKARRKENRARKKGDS